MDKHTPGPWASVPCQADHGATTAIQGVASDILARVPAGPRAVANAQLIAAAPDLLAALQAVTAELRQLQQNGDIRDSIRNGAEYLIAADAALAKARGEG